MRKLSFLSLLLAIFAVSTFAQKSELTGSWKNGNVGAIQYQNQTTGATKSGRSSLFNYKFSADGSYEFVGYMEMNMYNCNNTLFNNIKGKYTVEGNTISFNPARDYWKSTNSCAASGNKEQLKTPQKSVLEFTTRNDEYGNRLLVLTDAKGGETVYKLEKD